MEACARRHLPTAGRDAGARPGRLGLGHVPESNAVVAGSRHQLRAVRTEADRGHDVHGMFELTNLPPVAGIPEPDSAVPACRGKPAAVGTERDIVNKALMAG